MLLIILLIVFILWLLIYTSIEIVEENTVYVMELLGKFSRILRVGLNFKFSFLEQVAEKVTLKQQNFTINGRYHTQDKGAIDVAANIIFFVTPTEEAVKKYTYSLVNREHTIAATIENSLRASIARETHEDVLQKKEVLMEDVKQELKTHFNEWGIEIFSFQITGVHLPTG